MTPPPHTHRRAEDPPEDADHGWDGRERRGPDRPHPYLDQMIDRRIDATVKRLVPNGDERGHYDAHVKWMEDAADAKHRKKVFIDRVIQGLTGAAMLALGTAAWEYIRRAVI